MSVADSTSLAGILKQLYPYTKVKEVGYKNRPLLGMLKKRTDFSGESIFVPVRYSHQLGRSATFATAYANQSPNAYKKFSITLADDFAVGGIDGKAIRLARDAGAIKDGLKSEIDGLMFGLYNSLCHSLYGNGGGAIGRVSAAGAAATTLTLATPRDVVNFYVGMLLDGGTTDGMSGSVIAGGAAAKITAIDRDTSTITSNGANWNAATGINGLAATNYLFARGDFGLKVKGLSAWIPSTAPAGGDSHFGVDRSVDSNLGGLRVSAESTIFESILSGLERVFLEGGAPDVIMTNPSDYRALAASIEGQKTFSAKPSPDVAGLGFKGFEIAGPGGAATVHADPYCPKGTAFALQLDTWTLWSAGEAVGYLDDDGNKMLRGASTNAVEVRLGGYQQLVCDAPWFNVRVALPS